MIEYTSLDVSRRLAEAGFRDPNGKWGVHIPPWSKRFYPFAQYRSDTLMEWLLTRGFIDSIISYPDRTKVGYTTRGIGKDIDAEADTFPDALGEVVLKVLAKEAEHGKQGV